MGHRFVIHIAQQTAASYASHAILAIHFDVSVARQVDLQTALTGGLAGCAVSTALYCGDQIVLTGEIHSKPNIGRSARLHNQGRISVDAAIEHMSCCVVSVVTGQQQSAAQAVAEFLYLGLFEDAFGAIPGYRIDIAGNRR